MSYKKHWRVVLIVLIIGMMAFGSALVGLASTLPPNSLEWDGQGSDSLDCTVPEPDDPRFPFYEAGTGWIHWNITQGSEIDQGAKLVLGGSGSGTFDETGRRPVVEFFTPYFDVDTLEATFYFAGTLGGNSQFVISDYCPGEEDEPDPTGTICVNKANELEEPLEGWEFTLYACDNGNWVKVDRDDNPGTTNDDGQVCWDDLPYGKYRVVETDDRIDNGWTVLDPEEGYVDVELDSESTQAWFKNKKDDEPDPTGTIWVVKTDGYEYLSGWEFTLYADDNGDWVKVDRDDNPNTTNEDGELYWDNLPYGLYRVVETDDRLDNGWTNVDPGDGYVDVTLDDTIDESISVTFINVEDEPDPDPQGRIRIVKILLDRDGEPITDSDVRFNATIDPEVEVDWFSVNDYWESGDLAVGGYTITEVEHPNYNFVSISPADGKVTVTDDETAIVTITNQLKPEFRPPNGDDPVSPSISIRKEIDGALDGDEDLVFTVTIEGPGGTWTRTIRDNQTIYLDDLAFGTYVVTELDKEGFITPDSSSVELTSTAPHGSVVLVNRRITPEPDPEPTPPIVIIEEPELPAVEPPVLEEPEPEPEPEIVEEPEVIIEVPVAPELPRTGGMTALMSGIGALMAGAGALLLIRRNK